MLESMALALTDLSPVAVSGEVLPPPQLLVNLPILHRFLTDVVGDWLRAVAPYQKRIDSPESGSEAYAGATAITELQPALLKCLFSYAFFFVATDQAYTVVYKTLNRANKLAGLRVNHGKPPKATPVVDKIRSIRNWSIGHFPSNKADPIDAAAAMSWTLMTLSTSVDGCCDLEKLTFGGFRLRSTDASGRSRQSRDFEVQGLKALHEDCSPYLAQYDKVCAEYLRDLHDAIGGRVELRDSHLNS